MTTTQIELTRLDAQLCEAADLLRLGVDAEMAAVDSALRTLAEDIAARRRAALAALEADADHRLMATVPSQTRS